MKGTCHHVVIYYKLCYGINHLKAYIINIINFPEQKKTDLRVKTWGGDISPPSPPGFTPLTSMFVILLWKDINIQVLVCDTVDTI